MENVVKSTEVKRRNNVRKLTALGMLGAISLILVATVHFPIIPAAPFLEYDPAGCTHSHWYICLRPSGWFPADRSGIHHSGYDCQRGKRRPHRHHYAHLRYWQLCTDRRQHLPQK